MTKVKYTLEEAKKLKGKTDWEKLDGMTDEEVHQAALDDPDTQPLTKERLDEFTPVIHKGGGVYGHDKNKSTK
ncbi:hypothetical protein MNBD_GAMMA11-398 [hydrothermal vent metagenome]|uniref:Uncharacterized protein n=1 Tax=hydrothermal vent metagenome TaxID=652676 RepID=A0A3B0WRS1_9ZZZZ